MPKLTLRHQPMYAILGQAVADYRETYSVLANAGKNFWRVPQVCVLIRVAFSLAQIITPYYAV